MYLLFTSFIAGVLSSLAPCVLPLLPVIVGGSMTEEKDKLKPFIITGALFSSLVTFTLLLKASTLLITVPADFWKGVSGGIIIVFGIVTIWPHLWEKVSVKLNLGSNALLGKGFRKKGRLGDVLIGAALGPVFASCSPVYALILATILPQNLILGFVYIVVYTLGLCLALLLFARFGQSLISRFKFASNPKGWFRRGLGVLLVLVGLAIITGYDKHVQTYLLDKGYFDATKLEQRIIR